jgi:predicted acetyltransferase
MATEYTVSVPKKKDLDEFIDILCRCFYVPPEKQNLEARYFSTFDPADMRVIHHGSKIAGGRAMHRWGHFFGERSVPATGVAAVGILPEFRRYGAANTLMCETVRSLFKMGIPISTLMPANLALYRKSGYECAMERFVIKVPLKDISVRDLSLDIVPHNGGVTKAIKDAHTEFARHFNGNVDRSENWWKNIFDPYGKDLRKYLIKCGKRVEGYVLLRINAQQQTIWLKDFVVLTPAAGRRLLTFLADHSSILKEAKWIGSANDTLNVLLPDQPYELKVEHECMLRIVSVNSALEARGYYPGVEGELHLEISDDVVPQNNGRFTLKVKNGRGKVKKGGDGNLKLDIRALAQLYSCFLSPYELALAGHLEAPEKEMQLATSIFSGPRPWIRDDF